MAATSGIWVHVTRLPEERDKVKCNHCSKIFNFKGPTSNIISHLTNNHRNDWEARPMMSLLFFSFFPLNN